MHGDGTYHWRVFRFKLLYVWFGIGHGRREILHIDVTAHPTATWVIQQLGVDPRATTDRSPWQNGLAERWIGTIRRELLDHGKTGLETTIRSRPGRRNPAPGRTPSPICLEPSGMMTAAVLQIVDARDADEYREHTAIEPLARPASASFHSRSNTAAMPWPPPMHMVTSA